VAAQLARAPHKFVHQRAADALAAPRAAGNDVLQMRHTAPYPKNGGADHLLVVVRGEAVFAPFPIRRRDRARKAVGVVYVGLVIIVFGLLIKKMVAEIPFLYSLPEVSQYLGLPKWIFFAAIVAVSGLVIAYFLLCLVEIVLSRRVDVGEDANEQGEYPN